MARNGERARLERLVDEHLPQALRFALRLTGRLDAAEDVVQDALLRVSRSWRSFRGDSDFRTWLFRIVINCFRDRLARNRETVALRADVPEARDGDPSVRAAARELERIIAGCVSSLPPRQREVLVLACYEGLAAAEIALLLNITPSNVYATLYAARQSLRCQLAPYLAQK